MSALISAASTALPYFTDHKRTLNHFSSEIDRAPCEPVRLMYGSGSALRFIAIKTLSFFV